MQYNMSYYLPLYNHQIDGKKKIVPQRSSVKHGVAWNQEMDLHDYYTDIDRKYY